MVFIKYGNISAVDGVRITLLDPVKFLAVGNIVYSVNSNNYTTITRVLNSTIIELASVVGFSANQNIQIYTEDFDGESLSSFITSALVTDDLKDFLNVFSTELNSQWDAISAISANIDPVTCKKELLPILAASYGIPLNADYEEEVQRNFIRASQYAYKYKGTRKGMEAAFRGLGYEIDIKEYYVGKYVNVVDSVSPLGGGYFLITLKSSGLKVPALFGQFNVEDMVCEADGVGSNVPVKHPGNFGEISSVLSDREFIVYINSGTGFIANMDVVVIAKNVEARLATTSDYNDTVVNEYPLTSSFIKVTINDLRSGGGIITPDDLVLLRSFLTLYKSSHARLSTKGLNQEFLFIMDFRNPETDPIRGPRLLHAGYEPWEVFGTMGGTNTQLDMAQKLDEGNQLDGYNMLDMTCTIEFGETSYNFSDTISVVENMSVTV